VLRKGPLRREERSKMIARERETAILALLASRGAVSIRLLLAECPGMSAVTLRRDLARLEMLGKLRRVHGGATRADPPETQDEPDPSIDRGQHSFDGLILPPVSGRWAHTLRQQATRRAIPFLAESAPQVGGIYLGPRNHAGARRLGQYAGRRHAENATSARVLLVALEALSNTRERVNGFAMGFAETFPGHITTHRVDGRGMLREVIRQTSDIFRTYPTIDIVFGVNDHTILGALDVAKRLGMTVAGYSIGGEGGPLFEELARGGPLKATLALFPEVVGRLAIDSICKRFDGEDIGDAVITPDEIVTPETLFDFYVRDAEQWRIRPEVLARMCEGRTYSGPSVVGRTIGFMLHYPSHEWYRNLAVAMRQRSAEVGANFIARNAEDEIAEELRTIKRKIGFAAAALVRPRETLLLDGGESTRFFAEAVKASGQEATVITNALSILDILSGTPGVRVFMTGGEYQVATRSLVGPSLGALLGTVRADKAIVSPDGLSHGFGLSYEDERAALVGRRLCDAAREVIILADHGVVGLDSNVQAITLGQRHSVVTDAGTLPSHRLDLSSAGLALLIADDDEDIAALAPAETRKAV
jgi:DeoR/GlpR family transcriptional regulator of sugar metabolism